MPAIRTQGVEFYWCTSTAFSTGSSALVGQLTGFNGPDGQAADIDVTCLSDSAKTFLVGLADEGNISLDFNCDPNDDAQTHLRTDKGSTTLKCWGIKLTDTSTTVLCGNGYCKSYAISGAVDDKVSGNTVIRISGAVTWTTA